MTDADDVDTGMLDFLRLISSDDIGKDESNVQMLLKVHDNISKDLNDYTSVIDALQVFLNYRPSDLVSLELVEKLVFMMIGGKHTFILEVQLSLKIFKLFSRSLL